MGVKLLAIDTTEQACSAAVLVDDALIERFQIAPRRHAELILPMMDELLHQTGLRLGALDAVAFARGPGAFTGLRIAASIAQGAAFGAGLPVVPVSSLQTLAAGCYRENRSRRVLAAFDARMHEVYWGAYEVDADGMMRPADAEIVSAPADVCCPPGDDWVGAGSGWLAYGPALAGRCGPPRAVFPDQQPRAADVARLAARLLREGAAVAAQDALPVYLRDRVAWAKK